MARDAGADEVKRAYRQAALTLHPDKTGGDAAAAATFQRVSHAYSVLSDPAKKRYYDDTGARRPRAAAAPQRPFPLSRRAQLLRGCAAAQAPRLRRSSGSAHVFCAPSPRRRRATQATPRTSKCPQPTS